MPIVGIKRTLVGLVAAITAATALSACGAGGSGAGGGDTIRIAHNSNAAVLPVRVAEQQGYFKDAGLDVKFTKVENISTLPSALGKSFDIVLTPPTALISAKSQGIDMVATAGVSVDVPDNPTAGVVTEKGSGIKTFADLKGKKVGVLTESGTLHVATLWALAKAGLTKDDIDIVQVDGPAQADQLKAGRVDAVETIAPFRGQLLASGDNVDLGDPYLELSPEIGALLWTSSSSWADKHAKDLAAFRGAIAKAIDYIKNNEDSARTVLKDYTGLPDDVVQKTVLPNYVADARPQDLELWYNAMRKVGGFKGEVDLDDLVPAESR